jgi:hypothetical protein
MKFLAVFGFLAAIASGCADNTYNPNTQLGYSAYRNNAYGYNYTNGNYGYTQYSPLNQSPNGYYNPYIMNYSNYCQANSQARYQMYLQSQYMWSVQMNAGIYYQVNSPNTCSYRRFPTYTPSRCACVRAPCDCELVLSQYETRYRMSHTHTSTSYDSGSTSSSETHQHHATSYDDPSSSGGNERLSKNNESLNHFIAKPRMNNDDSRELYNRLEKTAEKDGDNLFKTGLNYSCFKTKKDEYRCDFEIDMVTGAIQQYHSKTSTAGASELNHGIATVDVKSDNLTILTSNPHVAIVTLKDDAYLKLDQAFIKIRQANPNENVDADTAKGETVQIKKITDGKGTRYEMELRFANQDGKAIPVKDWQ